MSRFRQTVLGCMLGLSLLVLGARYVVCAFDRSRRAYVEGALLVMVERMRTERVSAQWLEGPVYTLSPYGPGYYWVVGAIAPLTPWDGTLVPGRLVSVLATLATAALLAHVVQRQTRSWPIALASALIYLASPVVMLWGPLYRVDSLALLATLGAYATVEVRRYGPFLAAVLIVVGSLVKQTVALSALPILVYLWLRGQRREAASFALLTAGLGAAAWGAVEGACGGYYFLSAAGGHLSLAGVTQAARFAYDFLCSPLGVAGFLVVGYLYVTEPGAIRDSLSAVALLISTAVATAMAMKEGAFINYFLEPSLFAALVIGLHALPRLCAPHPSRAAMALGVLALVLPLEDVKYLGARLRDQPFAYNVDQSDWLSQLGDTDVLADGFGPCVEAALAAGKVPLVNEPTYFTIFVVRGKVDAAGLVRAMAAGRVARLVLAMPIEEHRRTNHWPKAVLDAIGVHYVLVDERPGLYIYAHRGAPAAPGPGAG